MSSDEDEDSTSSPSAARSNKRQKRSITDDLVCCITLELPYDPVTAEDGRVYERWAIEKYFASNAADGNELRSPYTTEPIGTRLFPAPQIKNHIEFLMEKDLIKGDLAKKWKEKDQERKDREELLESAESGDLASMELLAANYLFGRVGFPKDAAKAYEWCEKAHKMGSVRGTARLGEMMIKGTVRAKRNERKGFAFLGVAAERGSDLASFLLGVSFAYGWFGMTVDKAEAIPWLQKAISPDCAVQSLGKSGKRKAQQALEELLEEEPAL